MVAKLRYVKIRNVTDKDKKADLNDTENQFFISDINSYIEVKKWL